VTPAARRSLGRVLSRLADASVSEVLRLPQSAEGRCRRIGITGPSGAGKSTLIARLARRRLTGDGDLAIIVIDPTSPVSGGAILGDRIRMEELEGEERIYIRSLASRESLDGLADNLPDILAALGSFGFSEVLVETVGAGQIAHAIRALVDTLLLVLPPGAGDQIQAMKGGILEIADIYIVNKSDQPGAKELFSALRSVLKRRPVAAGGWAPPIVETSFGDDESLERLAAEIGRHQAWAMESERWEAARALWRAQHVGSLVGRRVGEVLRALPPETLKQPIDTLYRAVLRELTEEGAM
jgi:GTPase